MTRSRGSTMIIVTLLLMVGLAPAQAATRSAAEELTRVMPDDVMLFVTTSGGDALKDDYGQTITGKLCADPGVQSFYTSIKTELLRMLAEEEGEEAPAVVNMILEYAELATNCPLMVGVAGGIEVEEGPPACLFVILKAGQRKSEITEALAKLEELISSEVEVIDIQVGSAKMHTLEDADGLPLYWGWVGNYFVLGANDPQGQAMKYIRSPRATPTDHLKKVPGHGDILAVYYNINDLWSTVSAFAEAEGGEEDIKPVKVALEKLGVTKVGNIVGRVGISGSEVVSDSFMEISGSRTGILTAFKPVDRSVFKIVDPQAVSATAFNFDVAGVFDTAMDTLKAVSPDEGYPEVTEGLAELESELGFKIRDGLIESLGGPAVIYALPAGKMPEAPMGGFIVGIKLNDAKLFETTMAKIGAVVSKEADGMLQISSQTDAQGRTTHIWSVPPLAMAQVMPTWSIVDDQLIIGSNMSLCAMGVKQAAPGAGAKSLLDTDGYRKVASQLPPNFLSITYVDSQVQFSQMMMQLQQFWPLATMGAMQAGMKLPVMLPSLGHIIQEMQPSIEYSYDAPDGMRSHYQGTGFEVGLRSLVAPAVGAGALMPALARARQQGRRAVSMSNLKQLALSVIMYADDHDGKLPSDLATAKPYYGNDRVLKSPHKPQGFDGPSYIYVAGLSRTAERPHEDIVIYENPRICDEGANVAFLDGHVEFMRPYAFRQAIERTYSGLGKEAPEIRFRSE